LLHPKTVFRVDQNGVTRGQRSDLFVFKTEIEQRHRFTCRGKQRSLLHIAHGFDPQRVPGHDELTFCGQQRQAVSAIECPASFLQDFHPIHRPGAAGKNPPEFMHDDFGVGVQTQVMVTVGQQTLFQNSIVRELSVEAKAKPLSLVDVTAFKRLSVVTIVLARGGVSRMTNGRTPGQVLHQGLRLLAVIQTKDLGDAPNLFSIQQNRRSIGIVGRHPGGELSAVLDVQQHPGEQPGDLSGPMLGAHGTATAPGKVIDRRNTALVVQFGHER